MKDTTDEFSFILKQSEHGVGVFAMHDIKKGTYMRLFGNKDENNNRVLKNENIPKIFQDYCVHRDKGEIICPKDFGNMQIGWYGNHSSKKPNIFHDENYDWYALRDIREGEEILYDYNSLEEPEEGRDDYYKDDK